MKFLDYPELESLSNTLTFESAECKVFTRLEAYSCKAVTKEKRLFKALESAYQQTASTSPQDYLEGALDSPFGRLDQPAARKTLFLLISLLNGVFPDHDFSQVNPADFRREVSPAMVLHSLSTTLHSLRNGSGGGPRSYSTFTGSFDDTEQIAARFATSHPSSSAGSPPTRPFGAIDGATHAGLASLFDDIMDIRECEVYTFHPDMDSDPHACPEPDEEGSGFFDSGNAYYDDADDSTGAYATSEGPQTPRTPGRSAQRGETDQRRRGDFASSSLTSASSMGATTDEDEDIDGIGGLLWSTYAFFYNRRLKRVLFVSVWSR
ncbi:Maf1 regulator, partial [Jaminaea rosea]